MRIGIEGIPNFSFGSCFLIYKSYKKSFFWGQYNGFIDEKVSGFN